MKRFVLFLVLLLLAAPVYSLRKPHFGGNLRIADTLINDINRQPIFSVNPAIKVLLPIPADILENEVKLDFSRLNPEWLVELEQSVAAIQEQDNSCHWILDYPFFDHRHPNQIQLESGILIIRSEETDYLQAILTSRCLPPSEIEPFRPYRKTQFGFEANSNCVAGRPFLDSITPAPVDPTNPYLSFKLNDVDVLPVPEERFQQINADPELNIVQGPSYFVYLLTSDLKSEDIALLTSGTRIQDIAKVVLNDHAEVLLVQQDSHNVSVSKKIIEFTVPEEDPYRLLSERLVLEWQELGFTPAPSGAPATSKIEVAVHEILESDQDLARYCLLRKQFQPGGSKPWFEIWDEMEASGKLVPMLIHTTRIAARKNVVNLRTTGGSVDLADTWIIPEQ